MAKKFKIGRIYGLDVSARSSALIAFAIIWFGLSLIAHALLKLPLGSSLTGATAATIFHFASELWHNLGHALAARSTGYPMVGILYIGPLAMSRYPREEPELPAEIHMRRAWGGPISSLILSLITGSVALVLRPLDGTVWWVALFLFVDNLLVFTLGALLPLGFTDGSTILYWKRVIQKEASE